MIVLYYLLLTVKIITNNYLRYYVYSEQVNV